MLTSSALWGCYVHCFNRFYWSGWSISHNSLESTLFSSWSSPITLWPYGRFSSWTCWQQSWCPSPLPLSDNYSVPSPCWLLVSPCGCSWGSARDGCDDAANTRCRGVVVLGITSSSRRTVEGGRVLCIVWVQLLRWITVIGCYYIRWSFYNKRNMKAAR